MKCIITGHTSGIGKYLYEYYQGKNWEVIGMSRSNGYDILTERERIINDSLGADLFINNASSGNSQLELLKKLCKFIPKIVTMGSAGTEFTEILDKKYIFDKKNLEEKFKLITMNPGIADMLLIKLSFAETSYNREKVDRLDSDFTISYQEIANVIDFWINNSKIRQIDFTIKLTEYTINQALKLSNKSNLIEKLVTEVNELIK